MAVVPGQMLSHYKLLEQIGAGGMGSVWKAMDTSLDREVAIKVLPPAFATDADRLARFEREAKVLASLNHPRIAHIYGLHQSGETRFLAMELVPGEDLSQRLEGGAVPIEEALRIARQITEALEVAHENGIIHRDLKPANVVLKPNGETKVLDFGLAKVTEPDLGSQSNDPSLSPTATSAGTRAGVIMGTAAYMSPEQARGQALDKRTDIWSFGCILYELLTGQQVFPGETVSDAIAFVLTREPDWSALPTATPPKVKDLLRRCLHKDSSQRLRDIGDARLELSEYLSGSTAKESAKESSVAANVPAKFRWPLIWVGVVVVIVAVIATGLLINFPRGPAAPPTGSAKIMMAVLPFENLGGDPEQEFFSDGMTEEMIAQLGRLQPDRLGVIARTSVMSLKNTTEPVDKIGRDLGVDYLLEGSVRRAADRVRITAQLIQVDDQTQMWADTFERDVADVFAIQAEVADQIASALKVELLPGQQKLPSPARSDNPKAQEAYLRGRHFWNLRTEVGLRKAIRYFEEAVREDPGYARGYAGIAESYVLLPWYSSLQTGDVLQNAENAAKKALEIDDTIAEVYASLGEFHALKRNWKEAMRSYERAIELNPNYATAHQWYGNLLACLGKLDQGFDSISTGLMLDPLSLIINTNMIDHHIYAGRYDQAVDQARQALEIDPAFTAARMSLSTALAYRGNTEEAIQEAESLVELSRGHPEERATLGQALALAGERKRAQKLLDDLLEEGLSSPTELARIATTLGHPDQAISLLETAFREYDPWLRYIWVRPELRKLEGEARYEELMRKLDFPD